MFGGNAQDTKTLKIRVKEDYQVVVLLPKAFILSVVEIGVTDKIGGGDGGN